MAITSLPSRVRWMLGIVAGVGLLCCMFFLRDSGAAYTAGLSPLETRVLGQTRWLCGGTAALRVIVTDHRTGKPVQGTVTMTLALLDGDKPSAQATRLFEGAVNAAGTLDARFTTPNAPGAYELKITVESPLGNDLITQRVELDDAVQVLMTTDKPLYQPGQTMHLRALALDQATREAVTGETMIFEVEDARGNKVFKKRVDLTSFGIGATDFTLADEVNMGVYTLRAILPQGQTEKKVRVERYVLPKFKVAVTTDKPFYLPGDTVKGTVQADYFFGKPVAKGSVTVQPQTIDIGVTTLAELVGKTDVNGTYKFEFVLPEAFVGQPFEQGKAMIGFHVGLVDTADHLQEADIARPVVKEPILVAMVPESRALVPGLKNRVFLAAATPDGSPLRNVDLAVSTSMNRTMYKLTTDAMGLAIFEFVPGRGPVQLTVRAQTPDGRAASVTQELSTQPSAEGIILRAAKSLCKVGERINVAAISSTKGGTIYLDVIRNKQTILTKALTAVNGQAAMNLNLTDDMIGTLELRAYKILPNEDIIRDAQLMIVMPADDLEIEVAADKKQYRPGEEAVLTFNVRDQQKHPILAALGIAIVDESVFALSELQPGLEKIFFTLEKELMEPKYEIHGITPVDLIMEPLPPGQGPVPVREGARQRAAEMLLAGVPKEGDFDFRVNTYQQRWEEMKEAVAEEMIKAHEKIVNAVNAYREKHKTALTAEQGLFRLVDEGFLRLGDLRDRWGNFYKSNLFGSATYERWFAISSAGPDGRWGTVDDIKDISPYRRFKGGFDGGDVVMFNAEMPGGMRGPMGQAGPGGPLPAPMPPVEATTAVTPAVGDDGGGGAEPARIREFFPETMYWNPSIITDPNGKAEVRLPVADSITTWRMSMTANSKDGQLGSASAPLRVFQDFFVDIDLPIALTQHDRVEVPVAVYNYLPGPQTVTLTLETAPWFRLEGEDVKQVQMAKDEVKVVYFPISVEQIGRFPLTVQARGTELSDAIRRSIDVLPDGKEIRTSINDRLEGEITKTVNIPAAAIDGASTIWVKLYPGAFSQVVEGLDSMLRMPNGCFEQTSSTTYPNILVLDYMKQTKKINPELQMKAEQYINVGYQRLVTFECKGGGFSWFGDEPAHQILTAYGLLEFADMAKVHEIDANMLARTQQWLANQQKNDGTWEVKDKGIAEGITNRQEGTLRTTAYIAWALAESGFQGPQVAKGVQYVKAHRAEAKDPYTLAILLNLLTLVERDGDAAAQTAQALIDLAKTTEKTAYWASDAKTFTGADSKGADLETSGLAAYGLVKWGKNAAFTTKVLTYLVQSKDSFGTWSTTQGTVWALKTLLYASSNAFGGGKGTVTVLANGQQIHRFEITEEDSDVMRQVDLGAAVKEGDNAITLAYAGEGSLMYQIVARYYLPWAEVMKLPGAEPPMTITVAYDKTRLAQNDTVTATVTIKNNLNASVEMPLIDIGLPPGFTPLTENLEQAVADKAISRYTLAARQLIIYVERLEPGKSLTLTYQLKAKYPIRARTPQSQAYPYYNPEKAAVAAPQNMTVTR